MIRADHISKTFEGRTVLKDISVEFDTGKTNLIIGRSGSGKTAHRPASGEKNFANGIMQPSIGTSPEATLPSHSWLYVNRVIGDGHFSHSYGSAPLWAPS